VKDLFRRLLTPVWLRPERALWDAHELYHVREMLGSRFERPALEYGCTDGINTFVLLGGEFAPDYDDYVDLVRAREWTSGQSEPPDADYFRVFRPELRAVINKPAHAQFDVGVSWQDAHIEKSKRLAIYQELHLIQQNSPMTPLYGWNFRTIWSPNLFWSEPEHLLEILLEHARVLHQDGRILTILPDRAQIEANLLAKLPSLPADWRDAIDRKIGLNLTRNARSDDAWRAFFGQCGLRVSDHAQFLPRIVNDIYQVGFRPMFPVFLQMYSMLKAGSSDDILDVKRHWIDTVYHFLEPLTELGRRDGYAHSALWHLYELRHAR
jgi:hypothetical protein